MCDTKQIIINDKVDLVSQAVKWFLGQFHVNYIFRYTVYMVSYCADMATLAFLSYFKINVMMTTLVCYKSSLWLF